MDGWIESTVSTLTKELRWKRTDRNRGQIDAIKRVESSRQPATASWCSELVPEGLSSCWGRTELGDTIRRVVCTLVLIEGEAIPFGLGDRMYPADILWTHTQGGSDAITESESIQPAQRGDLFSNAYGLLSSWNRAWRYDPTGSLLERLSNLWS